MSSGGEAIMTSAIVSEPMTTEALLALPDDGTERWLIHGELQEKPMTVRNRLHSKVMASLTARLKNWRDSQPEPRGDVLCGDAGVRLARDPDTTVGVDIVYISPEMAARQSDKTTLLEGVPELAVEILSPYDVLDEINEKIDTYLLAGVPLVWVVDPRRRTFAVYRPKATPSLVTEPQELSGEDVLPGFRAAVGEIFR
jgi:Uma2 family endonuclease